MRRYLVLLLLISYSLSSYSLEVGDVAPNFSLEGSDGQIHQLSDYLGNQTVVIAWFPKAYTRGSTLECLSISENGHLLKRFAVTYFMASVDPIADNIGFAEQQRADFPILSDPSTQTALAYDVLSERGIAVRHTFYIGPDGRILAVDRNVSPSTSAQDMAEWLSSLGTPLAID